MVSPADLDVARKTMRLRSSSYLMTFVSTVWRGEVIMCYFNNIAKEISNVFCTQVLSPEDIENIEKIINDNILLDNVL